MLCFQKPQSITFFFAAKPLSMIYSYINLKNQCLDNDNSILLPPQIYQMTQSSSPICITDKNYDNDTYLYDLLMLCRSNFEEENNIWINYPEKIINSVLSNGGS